MRQIFVSWSVVLGYIELVRQARVGWMVRGTEYWSVVRGTAIVGPFSNAVCKFWWLWIGVMMQPSHLEEANKSLVQSDLEDCRVWLCAWKDASGSRVTLMCTWLGTTKPFRLFALISPFRAKQYGSSHSYIYRWNCKNNESSWQRSRCGIMRTYSCPGSWVKTELLKSSALPLACLRAGPPYWCNVEQIINLRVV